MFKQYAVALSALCLCSSVTLAELRDPTLPDRLPNAPTITTLHTDSVLTLTGIWISAGHKRAIINGVSVRPGQTLADGSRLLQIKPGHVVVGQNGVNHKLYLVPSVKKPVK